MVFIEGPPKDTNFSSDMHKPFVDGGYDKTWRSGIKAYTGIAIHDGEYRKRDYHNYLAGIGVGTTATAVYRSPKKRR